MSTAEIWRVDPATMRDVLLDRTAVEDRLGKCPAQERVWILSLLVLAQAHQRLYQWHEAAQFHEEALRLAHTRAREAVVRHQIGRQLFDEARYRDAAAEFEWASDLYRTTRRDGLAEASRQAMKRAREIDRTR